MNNESNERPDLPAVGERRLPVVTIVLLLAASAFTAALSPAFIPASAAMTAFCMIRLRTPLVLLALLPAWPIAVISGASWQAALIALAPVLPAFILAKTAPGQTRSLSVAFTASALGAFMLLFGALSLFTATGRLSAAAVREYLDAQTTALAESVVASVELAAGENPSEAVLSSGLVNVENVKAVFDAELPLLPGMIFAILTAAAYLSHLIFSGLHRLFGFDPLPLEARRMRLNIISAYVYAIFYLLVILLSSSSTADSLIVIAGRNIITVLTLPFAIAGAGGIIARLKPSAGTLTPVVVVFVAIAIGMFNPAALLSLAAFIGVIETFVSRYGSMRRHEL